MRKHPLLKATSLAIALAFVGLQTIHALEVRSVGSLIRGSTGNREIHIVFDKTVDATANDIEHYTLSAGTIVSANRITGLPPENAWLPGDFTNPHSPQDGRPIDNNVVALIVTGLTTGESYDLTLSGIQSMDGSETLAETTRTFSATPFTYYAIGGNRDGNRSPGNAIMRGDTGVDLISNGQTQWSNYDETDVAFMEIDGAFDYKAQIVYQDISSQWARSGIMMRENLDDVGKPPTGLPDTEEDPDGFGRYVTSHANPEADFNDDGTVAPEGGNNGFESNYRPLVGQATAGNGAGDPEYPDGAWVRLQRIKDEVRAYWSNDGEEWTQHGDPRVFEDLSQVVQFGFSYSPETGNTGGFLYQKPTIAQIRNMEAIPFDPVQITQQPQGLNVIENSTAQLSVQASGPALYQWYKDDEAIAGAEDSVLEFQAIKAGDGGEYYVRVENPVGEGEDSNRVTVEVQPDTTPPTPLWGAMIDLQTLRIQWSEPIDPDTGNAPGNYTVTGGSVDSAEVDPDDARIVRLDISGLSANQRYTLQITGVEDTAGIPVAEGTELPFVAQNIADVIGNVDANFNPDPIFVALPTRRRSDIGTGQQRGFDIQVVQNSTGANSIDQAETQQLKGLNGLPNLASPENTEGDIINYIDVAGGDGGFIGDDQPYPSVTGDDPDNFAMSIKAFLELEAGVYSIGVTSDDGFRLRSDKTVLMEFPEPRGPAQNYVEIVVPEDGLYPFELTYFELSGGATLEFFSTTDPNPSDPLTFLSLVNATDYIRAFRTRNFEEPLQETPSVDTLIPADGAVDITPDTNISALMTDGEAAVNQDSVELMLDGTVVAHTFNKTGDQIVISHQPAAAFASFTTHDVTLNYSYGDPPVQSSVSWSFTTGFNTLANNLAALDLFENTAGTRFIEAEDFNGTDDSGTAGIWIPDANGGKDGNPYSGGAYANLSATHDVDYHENTDTTDEGSDNYRTLESPNVPMGQHLGADTLSIERGDRGSFNITANWKIGWGDTAEWRNYTRDFNEGTYDVYAAVAHGDPISADEPGKLTGSIGIVTSDPTQPDQTVDIFGEFSGYSTGDWGTTALYKMHAVDDPGTPAQATLPAGESTIRFTWVNAGDVDYMAFVPAEPLPPIGGGELGIAMDAEGNVIISWPDDATLQVGETVTGPWVESNQGSPATFSIQGETEMYFRTVSGGGG